MASIPSFSNSPNPSPSPVLPHEHNDDELTITLKDSNFMVNGQLFLSQVPSNIIATPSPYSFPGCFVGFHNQASNTYHHVVPIGKLIDIPFMSIFRFKVWWTTHWTGNSGRDLEHETQFLLLDKSHHHHDHPHRPYVLLLPLIEGPFRACLQPGVDDYVDLCAESGSSKVSASSFNTILYINAGEDPFTLVNEAIKVAEMHLGTFKVMQDKTPPPIVDKFGWCTWDAFYLKVHPQGVLQGVKGLVDGGCPPGLVLLDDGWQSICHDDDDPFSTAEEGINRTSAGEQMPCRLIKFEENSKFREYTSSSGSSGPPKKGMGGFVRDLKESFPSVDYVYVWHALCGYWGGLRPNVPGLPESKVITPKLSPGVQTTMEDLAVDKIVNNGIGLVPPEIVDQLYEGLHSHLESVGIDGVKVDVIHLLEMVGEEYGGRVELAKAYYKALSSSVRKHFKGNGVIASMELCNDFMFLGTEAISLGRAGDDFWCTDPSGDPNGTFWLQGCHMVHCAYNSLWIGNFIQPDWDMFQSTHPCAKFHAASRAISGGPIYISDTVGNHDFQLLQSLVLHDGSILRCRYYALPTRDCLFEDPLHNGKSMLKIWNLNKYTGVIGAFNCQGGGWNRESRSNTSASKYSHKVTSVVVPGEDVEWKQGPSPINVEEVETFALYKYKEKKLLVSKASERVEVSLEPFDFELITVSPVRVIGGERCIRFAPIGLVNMLNSGGSIQSLELEAEAAAAAICAKIGIKGEGELKVFSSEKPVGCRINGSEVTTFVYEEEMIVLQVPWPNHSGISIVEYHF